MQAHEKVYRNKKDIIVNNFLGGFAWAAGATIGVGIILYILSKIILVPIVGTFVLEVANFVLQNNPQLIK